MKHVMTAFTAAAMLAAGSVLSAQELAPLDAESAPAAKTETVQTPAPAAETKAETAPAAAPAAETPAANETAAKDDAQPQKPVIDENDPTVIQADSKVSIEPVTQKEDAPAYKKCKLIENIILTADYQVPRMLAETACNELNVPYLLIMGDAKQPDINTQIMFFAPGSGEPLVINAKDLSKFLAYIRARNVIILGNADYVPAFYSKAIPAASRRIRITDADWQVNSVYLSSVLRSDKPGKAYRAFLEQRTNDLKNKQ